MIIPPERIHGLRPVNNYVIVEPIVRTDEINYKTLKLWFDNTVHREQYQPVVCRVISIARKIIYDPVKVQKIESDGSMSWVPRYENTMPWKTT